MSAVKKGRGPGQPDGKDDMINRFGTYNIQDTADTSNTFPAIAQGLPREKQETGRKRRERH